MSDFENDESSPSAKRGLSFALTSGVLAAVAATFGKFALTQSETIWICELCAETYNNFLPTHDFVFCNEMAIYLQFLAFLMMLGVNALMWTTFVKALRHCKTSLEATVTNTAANFFASALVGQLLFGESLSILWWLGTLFIIFGLALMNYSQSGMMCCRSGNFRGRKLKIR